MRNFISAAFVVVLAMCSGAAARDAVDISASLRLAEVSHIVVSVGADQPVPNAMALSPDGRHVAVTDYRHGLRLWDASSGNLLAEMQEAAFGGDRVIALLSEPCLGATGTRPQAGVVLFACDGSGVRPVAPRQWIGNLMPVPSCRLIVGAGQKRVAVLDTRDGRTRADLENLFPKVENEYSLATSGSPGDCTVYVGFPPGAKGASGRVFGVDLKTGQRLENVIELKSDDDRVTALLFEEGFAISPTRAFLAVDGARHPYANEFPWDEFDIIDVRSGALVHQLRSRERVTALAFIDDNRLFFVRGAALFLLHIPTGEVEPVTIPFAGESKPIYKYVIELGFSRQSMRLAVAVQTVTDEGPRTDIHIYELLH